VRVHASSCRLETSHENLDQACCAVAGGSCRGAVDGRDYYVRPGGSDSCSGTVDGDYTGSGSACAFKTIDKCDAAVRAGDTCQVAAGTYAQTLNPANSGSSSAPIVYVCPSRNCVVKPSAGDCPGHVQPFVCDSGWVRCSRDMPLEPWGGSSDGQPAAELHAAGTRIMPRRCGLHPDGWGDGQRDGGFHGRRVVERSIRSEPHCGYWRQRGGANELRTVVRNGVIRGWINGMAVVKCTDCVVDGVWFSHSRKHMFEVGNVGGVNNLTIKNSVFMASGELS